MRQDILKQQILNALYRNSPLSFADICVSCANHFQVPISAVIENVSYWLGFLKKRGKVVQYPDGSVSMFRVVQK